MGYGKDPTKRESDRKPMMSRQEFLQVGAGAAVVGLMTGTSIAQINRLPPGTVGASTGKKLRAMLARPGQPVFVAHAIDALSAQMMQEAGYEASFIGTSGVQSRWTNLADRGITTMMEAIRICKYFTEAVPTYPLIVDGDAGHGGPYMVKRFIAECIKAGLAGIRIDDQSVEKKRTTGNSGIIVASREDAVERYKAACDARDELDPDFVVQAQMYTREAENGGVDEALARIPLYEQAGVDWVHFTRAQNVDEMKKGRAVAKKFFGGMNGPWAKGFTTVKHYGDIGLNSIWGQGPGREADDAVDKALAEFKKRGPEFVTESLGTARS
jgi:2-methylisocitrate lyase-like PEP mutase family enzyme